MKIGKHKYLILALAVLLVTAYSSNVFAQEEIETPQVGEEVNGGYLRVYYLDDSGEKVFISAENQNSKQESRAGDYVSWVTEINDQPGQVFIYHIPSSTTTQLTSSGTNLNPQVDENGRVVWEGWVEGAWQVFFYDGTGVKQITSGDLAINPQVEGDNIIMARRGIAGTWRSTLYSISSEEFADVDIGPHTKHPELKEKRIFQNGEEFSLITDDIYLLDFEAVPSAVEFEPTTEQDILEEILGPDATSSGEIKSSTVSAELKISTPSASQSAQQDN